MEIKKGEFLGTISKSYSTDGRVLLKFNPDYIEDIKKKEALIQLFNK